VRVGLISDTHGKLRPEVFDRFHSVDLILHAGDIGSPDIITELETIAPVRAVHGNTDDFAIRKLYGEELDEELEGKYIKVVHGHMLGSPNPANLRAAYVHADLIVYGHTHKALCDDASRPIVVNPGAAGPARFNLKASVAILDLPSLRVSFHEL
jgi:uncharacterized protein